MWAIVLHHEIMICDHVLVMNALLDETIYY